MSSVTAGENFHLDSQPGPVGAGGSGSKMFTGLNDGDHYSFRIRVDHPDGSAEEIDSDVPVDIIAYNPDGDPQPWALWLVPAGGGGDGTGGGPVLLKTKGVGSHCFRSGVIVF